MTRSVHECKVRYKRVLEDGTVRNVSNNYIVIDAVCYSQVEVLITDKILPITDGQHDILSIKRSTIKSVYVSDNTEDDHFFKAKIVYFTLDEKSGKEKKISEYVLVQAKSPEEAIKRMNKELECIAVETQIASIAESNIVDVIK